MKKIIITVLFAIFSIVAFADSICGGGFRFDFNGGGTGTFKMYSNGSLMGEGHYLIDNHNTIRLTFSGSTEVSKLEYSDGGWWWGRTKLTECK